MKGVIAFVLALCLSVASSVVLKFDEYNDQWQAWPENFSCQDIRE